MKYFFATKKRKSNLFSNHYDLKFWVDYLLEIFPQNITIVLSFIHDD